CLRRPAGDVLGVRRPVLPARLARLHRAVVAAERAGLPAPPPAGLLSDEGPSRLARLARRLDEHPALLALFRAARRRLPGDREYGDPLSLGGEPPGLLGQRLALVAAERPSALKELGFSALQVWQSLSEAQG